MQHIIGHATATARERIAAACAAAAPARQPGTVTLVAVSKRQPAAAVRAAHACGLRDFGENYVQEAAAKAAALAHLAGLRWHLVGPLQSNKAGEAARLFTWVHALDRERIARRLGAARAAAGLPALQACVQVNLGGEANKAGCRPAQARDLVKAVAGIAGLKIRGLMCIPEAGLDHAGRLARFGELRELLAACQQDVPGLDTLSMGMSADYAEAIACGATMVRLGTTLFGARP